MGASCSSCKTAESNRKAETTRPGGTLGVMFGRIDKDGKGFIDLRDLKALMKDDYKAYFQGRGAEHIMQKYGQDGKMSFENFQMWWSSTYTTYNEEEALAKAIDDVLLRGVDEEDEAAEQQEKDEQQAQEDSARPLQGRNVVPSKTSVAVSRS